MTTIADISTTVPINLGKLHEMNQLLQDFIEIGYGVQVISTSTDENGEVSITLRGLDSKIRFFIKDEFDVDGEAAEQYILKTRAGEVPFWNLNVFLGYMADKGWTCSSEVAEETKTGKIMNFRLTKYLSPTKGVSIFLNRCYNGMAEGVAVFSVDVEKPDEDTYGTQYFGEINYRDVAIDADSRVQSVLST